MYIYSLYSLCISSKVEISLWPSSTSNWNWTRGRKLSVCVYLAKLGTHSDHPQLPTGIGLGVESCQSVYLAKLGTHSDRPQLPTGIGLGVESCQSMILGKLEWSNTTFNWNWTRGSKLSVRVHLGIVGNSLWPSSTSNWNWTRGSKLSVYDSRDVGNSLWPPLTSNGNWTRGRQLSVCIISRQVENFLTTINFRLELG